MKQESLKSQNSNSSSIIVEVMSAIETLSVVAAAPAAAPAAGPPGVLLLYSHSFTCQSATLHMIDK